MQITKITALEILDSRGNPTVEASVTLADGTGGRAAVPSGASTGIHEALELRDDDAKRFHGEGVQKAIHNIQEVIAPALISQGELDLAALDKKLLELDGTKNKSNLGANAILAVSLAFAWAAAASHDEPLFKYISQVYGAAPKLPRPMFNIMNGGRHANWATDIQEFMVIPLDSPSFADSLRMGSEIFHALEDILKSKGLSTNVGNEGGFSPALKSNNEALDLIMQAIESAGYTPGTDVGLGMDIAASEFVQENQPGEADDEYLLKTEDRKLKSEDWKSQILEWISKYPLVSIEDPFAQDSWQSWHDFIQSPDNKLEQVVGDDLLVTNAERIQMAIDKQACNALLVKVNQIGSLSETFAAMKLSESAGWKNIVSHRSGETEDVTISHLAVGTGCGQIKSGAPSRGERTAKYNELLRIEQQLVGAT